MTCGGYLDGVWTVCLCDTCVYNCGGEHWQPGEHWAVDGEIAPEDYCYFCEDRCGEHDHARLACSKYRKSVYYLWQHQRLLERKATEARKRFYAVPNKARKDEMEQKVILDACCGGRMCWFNKDNPNVVFMDKRQGLYHFAGDRTLEIKPDVIGDFRAMPFEDESFYLVLFDPPHLLRAGENSWLAKKYGKLGESWADDIRQGFDECMRVLKPYGTLIFKWNEEQISTGDLLKTIEQQPLFGQRRGKTIWLVFMKEAR